MAAPLAGRDFAVVAYNVENLFDADGIAAYEDYAPDKYPPGHLAVKVANIAKVLARVNKGAGPEIVLFNEVELDQTPDSTVADYDAWLGRVSGETAGALLARSPLPNDLAGLPAEAWLLKACADAGLGTYHVAVTNERPGPHEDGNSRAVRNVVFSRFPILETRTHPVENARAILEVRIEVDGAPFTVFANHWKSMRGGSSADTEPIRRQNAAVLRARLDQLLGADPQADILLGGDFNTHYNQKQRERALGGPSALIDVLGSQGNELSLRGKNRDLYNLWFELPSDQRGSDVFKGDWGTLIHLLLSRGLYDQNGVQYQDNSFAVMKFPGLNANIQGAPVRWSRGENPSGFSDHFPLYARFRTVEGGARDKWMPLTRPSETDQADGTVVKLGADPVNILASAAKLADLPADADLRDGSHTGRVFYIEEKGGVNEKGHVKIRFRDLEYDVFSHQKEIRDQLRAQAREGRTLRFYGELGQYKGAWQFVVQGKEWVR